ncbi:type VII secretion protein EssC [Neobacillus mesonae]|nr:type VII secretion protein EssC [Neobacillus mesonae]
MNVLYQRSPRMKEVLKKETLEILRPPIEPNKPSFSIISIIIPLVMTLATVGLYFYLSRTGRFANSSYMTIQMVMMTMMLATYTIPFFVYLSNKKEYHKRLAEREDMYKTQLAKHREELEREAERQVQVSHDIHGDPEVCSQIVKNRHSSLWERSPDDDDFLAVRAGVGAAPFRITIAPPRFDGYEREPLIEAAHELANDFQMVEGASIALPIFESKIVGIVGDREDVLSMLRVIITQITTRHSPDEVKLAAFYEEKEAEDWEWMRWFPHVWDDERGQRFMADRHSGAHQLADSLYTTLNRRKNAKKERGNKGPDIPAYIVLMSERDIIEEEPLLPLILEDPEAITTCTIILASRKEHLPMHCQLVVEARKTEGSYSKKTEQADVVHQSFISDRMTRSEAEISARNMAPLRLKRSSASEIPPLLPLFDMMEVSRVEQLSVFDRWSRNRYPNTLPVPMGVRAGGKRVYLNLHDKIERQGHGPHGLIAGTTGSGKSEVIQSIVASLASEFHPHDLAFMLIDYKGGGMSNTFDKLPHVVGTITNLDQSLMERAKISLRAELVRRQKILNDAGNLQHIDEYYKWLNTNAAEPLPHLVIIIDEFAQLKREQPEFMDELISIAAIGRTLGVHLILATQKPAGVVDDKIWSNSRFRICLRVQSEGDSRDMIKIPNAAWITKPGRGYFQVGSDEVFEEMQFAWSGAPYTSHTDDSASSLPLMEVRLNGKREPLLTGERVSMMQSEGSSKQLQVFIDHISEVAEQAGIERLQGPWLPPLPEVIEWEELESTEAYASDPGQLEPVVGIVDDLINQKQLPMSMNVSQGHLAVYGMPGLGKTSFVQTLLMSLARGTSNWHGYVIDMGRMMRDFNRLPQIGGVMSAEDNDRIKRLFRYLAKVFTQRRDLIADAGVKTVASYRRSTGQQLPQIIVVIDGYLSFRNSYPDENEQLELLLREGTSLGITFVVTANRITDIFEKIRSNITNAITFEMADPSDYYYAVGRPARTPNGFPPGRGLVKGQTPPLEFQAVLPVSGTDEAERADQLRSLIGTIRDTFKGTEAQKIEPLPDVITLEEVIKNTSRTLSQEHRDVFNVPVGLMTDDLEVFNISLREGPHFMVASPLESGKTSFMQTWMLSLAYHYSPEELHMYSIDTRYGEDGLSSLRHLPHIRKIASRDEELMPLIQEVHDTVMRLSANDTGPEVVLFIDDADTLAKQMNDFTMKDQLSAIVRQGRDRGVHVIIAGVAADFPTFGADWVTDIKASQSGLLFGTLDPNDLSFFRIPFSESNTGASGLKVLPPGQGYYVKRRFSRVKAALPWINNKECDHWLEKIRDRWHVVV